MFQNLKVVNKDKKRILIIQGGGIKGVVPAEIIRHMQIKLKCKICQSFDLIVGTSTGAIIGSMLAFGVFSEQIAQVYIKRGRQLFKKYPWYKKLTNWNLPLYDRSGMIDQMTAIYKKYFGTVPFMGQSKTNLALTTFGRMSGRTHKIMSWDQRHVGMKMVQSKSPFGPIRWSALAAPHYFGQIVVPFYKWWEDFQTDNPHWQFGAVFQDGGQGTYNSPIRLALQIRLLRGWHKQKMQILCLGCGQTILKKNFNYVRDDFMITQQLKYLSQARNQSVYDQLKSAQTFSKTFDIKFQRLSPILSQKQDKLDALQYIRKFWQCRQILKEKIDPCFLVK